MAQGRRAPVAGIVARARRPRSSTPSHARRARRRSGSGWWPGSPFRRSSRSSACRASQARDRQGGSRDPWISWDPRSSELLHELQPFAVLGHDTGKTPLILTNYMVFLLVAIVLTVVVFFVVASRQAHARSQGHRERRRARRGVRAQQHRARRHGLRGHEVPAASSSPCSSRCCSTTSSGSSRASRRAPARSARRSRGASIVFVIYNCDRLQEARLRSVTSSQLPAVRHAVVADLADLPARGHQPLPAAVHAGRPSLRQHVRRPHRARRSSASSS